MRNLVIESVKFICIVFIGIILGAYINKYINKNKVDYSIENLKLIKKIDSLDIIIYQRDVAISIRDSDIIRIKKNQVLLNSLIKLNHNSLKNEKIKVKNLSDIQRANYVDSLLKGAGIRK